MKAHEHPIAEPVKEKLRLVNFPDGCLEEPAPFKVKQYYKKELAQLYGVHLNTLVSWINRHIERFEEIGYHKTQKLLDPAQVRLFIEIFDLP